VRFRHKLSIVLVGLALVPLVGAGLIVQALLARDEVEQVDTKLAAGAAGAATAYTAQLNSASLLAAQLAGRPDVARAFRTHDPSVVEIGDLPEGIRVALVDNRGVLLGSIPTGEVWKTTAELVPPTGRRRVIVSIPLDTAFLARVLASIPTAESVGLALVVNGQAVAGIGTPGGPVSGLEAGTSTDATIGGAKVRAQAVPVAGPSGDALIVTTYPSARITDRIDSLRLQLLIPLALLAGLVVVLALLAADRISRALTDLSQRALGLVRSDHAPAPSGGDELQELGAALDTMSTELTERMTELENERARLKSTLTRYGETLAATHDMRALLSAVLETAMQATNARGGRLLLYAPDRGDATEQVRMGTARGSRADLPMVVSAGSGMEGMVLTTTEPQVSSSPRPMVAVPIEREHKLLGVLTVVDHEDGEFLRDDVETLAGLANQAGVAIENARLHLQVEQQAITDPLTGLANRRQFFDTLEREFERAQRFGTPLSLIMLDIDNFKQMNDVRGHLAGDAVLHGTAGTIEDLIREIDLAARYGGEEFGVLLPQTNLEGAKNLAERLREAVAQRVVTFGEDQINGVTASFGVASGPRANADHLDLVARADAALYRAKRGGKNRVEVDEPNGGSA
jgi:diguanylate cyclase (GGDEF)-like protein